MFLSALFSLFWISESHSWFLLPFPSPGTPFLSPHRICVSAVPGFPYSFWPWQPLPAASWASSLGRLQSKVSLLPLSLSQVGSCLSSRLSCCLPALGVTLPEACPGQEWAVQTSPHPAAILGPLHITEAGEPQGPLMLRVELGAVRCSLRVKLGVKVRWQRNFRALDCG